MGQNVATPPTSDKPKLPARQKLAHEIEPAPFSTRAATQVSLTRRRNAHDVAPLADLLVVQAVDGNARQMSGRWLAEGAKGAQASCLWGQRASSLLLCSD